MRQILRCLLLLCLCACSDSGGNKGVPQPDSTAVDLVARIGDREITAAELDHSLRLQLYDLALVEYELRLDRLAEMIGQSGGAEQRKAEVLLEIPRPPRIGLPQNTRRARGNPEAPITIAIFCSYQSPHCKSIQPALRRLGRDYAGWTRQKIFDLPLKFHREGQAAATAVRCAGEQDAMWRYQDGLYAYSRSLGEKIYARLAAQLDLDVESFARCLESARYREAIAADMAFAANLGIGSVPVVFINGLYIKGPREYGHYAMWVEKELRRMGVVEGQRHPWALRQSQEQRNLPMTRLPLALVGVSLSERSKNSSALIEIELQRARSFAAGSELLPGVHLREIYQQFVVIDNHGELQKLPLRGTTAASVPLTESTEREAETLRRIEQPLGPGSRKLVDPSGVLPLGRDWLEQQLENRAALEKKFARAEMEVEGHHLLRLEGIVDSEFFTALGFEENDVLLRVNDTWVHSGQNNLWSALTSGQVVDVAFMRKGLPQRLQYIVEERSYFEEGGTEAESGDGEEGGGEN